MREEDSIQRVICDYVAAVAPGVLIYAIPNASARRKGARASNAVSGLLPGMPDLGLILPGGRAGFLEVKTKTGRLSEAQKAVAARIDACGGLWRDVRSIDDVREAFMNWQVRTREAPR